jgi:hypothetical protein
LAADPCPDEEALLGLLAQRLDDPARDRVVAHLDLCDHCIGLVSEMVGARKSKPLFAECPSSITDWVPPGQIEEYRIDAPIGRGAVGQVYRAMDTRLDRPVAIKFLAIEPSPAARQRFAREARAVARLSHANVVTVYRVGEIQGRPYLVSELLSGESLDRARTPMPWPEVLDIGLQAARGLRAAHEAGVFHRDIKPGNVIRGANGSVKLLDFGLAKVAAETEPPMGSALAARPELEPSLTATGALLGTPLYMAPEAWGRAPLDARSDVYSLGALLYELCAGHPPQAGLTVRELQRAALSEEAPALSTLVPQIDPKFAATIDRCIRRLPEHRFPSAAGLCEALEAIPVQGGRRHPRGPVGRLAIGAAALALVAGLAIVGLRALPRNHSAAHDGAVAQRCSVDRWCWDANWPGSLLGVWGSSASDVWAVGQSGQIRHWQGARWTTVESETAAELQSVHGTGPRDVWAVGEWGTIVHWDGGSWTPIRSGTTTQLVDVWMSGPKDGWVVGRDGVILRWNGAEWQQVQSGTTSSLLRVWGTGPHDVWAAGSPGVFVHWNGATWKASRAPAVTFLTGLGGSSPDDVWAVGFGGAVMHFDGQRWAQLPLAEIVPSVDPREFWFNHVVSLGAHDVWLLPKRSSPLHWNGRRWTGADPGTPYELVRLWGSGPTDVWAVGDMGTTFHWDGARWAPGGAIPEYREWTGLWGRAADDVWAVGLRTTDGDRLEGVAQQWDGSRWRPIGLPPGPRLMAIWGTGAGEKWAVGDRGRILHDTGGGFAAVASGTTEDLRALWGSGPGDVWAAGAGGTVLRWNGRRWARESLGRVVMLRGLAGSGRDNVWLVGDQGTTAHWEGGRWTLVPTGSSRRLLSVWASSPDDAWAGGEDGLLLHWNGRGWTAVFSDTPLAVAAIWGASANDVWAATGSNADGTLLHWNGHFWNALSRTPNLPLRALWGSSRTDVWAAGFADSVLHYQP